MAKSGKTTQNKSTAKFVFRNNDTVGKAGAEQDEYYLTRCFVDTGLLDILQDTDDARCILLGRTGAGKSALLKRLTEVEEHVIPIRLESLALAYISNSNVLNFFDQAGVDLSLFYRWLWNHILCISILKAKYANGEVIRKQGFANWLSGIGFGRRKHEVAINYLKQWGEDEVFWKETETIIKEVTRTVENELKGSIDGHIEGIASLSAAAARKLTQEQKEEVVNRATEVVVNKVQMRHLSQVMDLLSDLLQENKQQRFYVTIDKLDEDWAEDRIRLRLIQALLRTALDFASVKNAKIIVAIRSDLLDRVFRMTRSAGFQEEKYKTSYIGITWTRQQLIEVLDARIALLVKNRYTSEVVDHSIVLSQPVPISNKVRQPAIDYLLDRTLLRPRDIIQFFNNCIVRAEGQMIITPAAIRDAEGIYSRERFRALLDEWYAIYPNLTAYAQLLKNKPETFHVRDLGLSEIEDVCLQFVTSGEAVPGADFDLMSRVAEGSQPSDLFRRQAVYSLYRVGMIGIKADPTLTVSWSFDGSPSASEAEITEDTSVVVHKTFWRMLGTANRQKGT